MKRGVPASTCDRPETQVTSTALSARGIRDIYEDFALGRLDRLSEVLDELIDFVSYAPPDVFPYLGRRHGRNDVLAALAEVHKQLEIISFRPMMIVVDENQAALTVIIKIRQRATKRSAIYLASHFLRFRKGRMVEFCGIIDLLNAMRQLGDSLSHQTDALASLFMER